MLCEPHFRQIEVIDDVSAKGIPNARGMRGVVTDVVVLCETDPACCCAELATDAPVTVRLERAPTTASTSSTSSESVDGGATKSAESGADQSSLVGYFCEEEVERVR